MSGLPALTDFIRDISGAGINGSTVQVKRLSDNASIASLTTASDAVPLTALPGYFSVDETTFGYPGPTLYSVTSSGSTKVHTSKSTGQFGSVRAVDLPRGLRPSAGGVQPNVLNELLCSASGSDMVISVASGAMIAQVGTYGMVYSWPATRTVTLAAADGSNPRIDTIVLRFYPPGTAQEGRVDLAALTGVAAASPTATAPTQNVATIWEVPLCTVRVETGVSVIASGKVTDARTWCMLYPAGVQPGDTFYVDATGRFSRLAKGTDGQVPRLASGLPTWATLGTMADQAASAVAITGGTAAALVLTQPAIADFTLADHDHSTVALGGLVAVAGYPTMVGDAGAGGTKGAVPAPTVGAATKYLRGDATWQTVPTGDTSSAVSASVDGEIVVFSSTTGKLIKRANGLSGIAKLTAGVVSVVTAPAGTLVGTSDAQTLTNKSLTSPAISSPSGLVKGDVGLGSVDNTSDATKNAAAVTLTNKTLTTPTIASFANAHHDHSNSAGGNNVLAASVDTTAITSGDFLKSVAGAIAGGAFGIIKWDFTHRGSSSGSVSSTTGVDIASLTCTVTLISGFIYDMFFMGSVNANAPSSDFIYAGSNVDGTIAGYTDTGTVGGERALGFVGVKQGVSGDGSSHSAAAHMKVGSGSGSINAGWALLIAIPRPA